MNPLMQRAMPTVCRLFLIIYFDVLFSLARSGKDWIPNLQCLIPASPTTATLTSHISEVCCKLFALFFNSIELHSILYC